MILRLLDLPALFLDRSCMDKPLLLPSFALLFFPLCTKRPLSQWTFLFWGIHWVSWDPPILSGLAFVKLSWTSSQRGLKQGLSKIIWGIWRSSQLHPWRGEGQGIFFESHCQCSFEPQEPLENLLWSFQTDFEHFWESYFLMFFECGENSIDCPF